MTKKIKPLSQKQGFLSHPWESNPRPTVYKTVALTS